MKKRLTWLLQVVFFSAVLQGVYASNPLATEVVKNNSDAGVARSKFYHGNAIQPGRLVFKMKASMKAMCAPSVVNDTRMMDAIASVQGISMKRKFTNSPAPATAVNRYGRPVVDLSLIYELQVPEGSNMDKAVHTLMATGLVEYAEPLYVQYMDYTPNDPSIGLQYHINKISAPAAWDITKGDTNVVIGIVDSGTDWDHPDLAANIKYNWADPINGVDDDNDGFIDNFRGWDVSENTNNPMVVASDHGSHVSGCAAAVTDNNVGVASPGFNCKFLPVKSTHNSSVSTIDNGYDGIVYAADHGVDIINCSWGRTGTPSQFEQDIINYVTFDKDVLVVAAAGNDGIETEHYPSSYASVISVGSTGTSDAKSGFSNYSYNLDVCAPGSNIYSTVFNDTYTAYSGTSMSSPVAAGCAAMIKSRFPWMNALQIGEQLRITSDNIYSASGNAPYQYKLGKGRVNLFTAVTDSLSPGVIVKNLDIDDHNDKVFVIGDTLNITSLLQNLLRPTTNLVCTLSSSSPYVTILNGSYNAGVINTLDSTSNSSSPFLVVINPSAPTNTPVIFRITMNDGSWSDFYAFSITVNVDYINIDINDVATSITSKSLTGYNQSGQIEGIGFTYMGGSTLLYEMGLMVGASGTQVSDNVRGDAATYDDDFKSSVTVLGQNPGVVSDFDAYGQFRDNGSTSTASLNLLISHKAYAWTSTPDRKYIMLRYFIHNNGSSTLNNLYAGLFADWDIPTYSNNKASEDAGRRMGYVWSTDVSGLFAGIKLLSHTGNFNHYAIDNTTTPPGVDLSDGYSNAEKYTTLSTPRSDAGNTATTGNDVIDVVSSGPVNLAPGDSVEVAFALIAGEDLGMIQASADAAQTMYDNLPTGIGTVSSPNGFGISRMFPNPVVGNSSVEFTISKAGVTVLSIFDANGALVRTVISKPLAAGTYTQVSDLSHLAAGNYFYTLRSGDQVQTLPFTISR